MSKTSNKNIKAIIGLGNPGPEYSKTYHNVGLLFLDFMASEEDGMSFPFQKPSRKNFEFATDGLTLIKTLTFMNLSGTAVKEALSFFKLNPEEIIITHDDSDMIIGDYKIAFDQSSGGHKGIQSIIDTLKTQKFYRLKIGIRPKEETTRQKAEEFVLKKIRKEDEIVLKNVFQSALKDLK